MRDGQSEAVIRRFRPGDAEAVSNLVQTALRVSCGPDYPPEPLGSFIAAQTPECMLARGASTHFYVAVADGRPVGCGAVGPGEDGPGECCIYSFYVLPACQRRGIGRRLMAALEADPLAQAASRILLHASRTALPFYRAMGFDFRGGRDTPDAEGLYRMEKRV